MEKQIKTLSTEISNLGKEVYKHWFSPLLLTLLKKELFEEERQELIKRKAKLEIDLADTTQSSETKQQQKVTLVSTYTLLRFLPEPPGKWTSGCQL